MSTKTKASSKKATIKKATVKKNVAKKPVAKKVVKSPVKAKPIKKAVAKKAIAKKAIVKKPVKKVVKTVKKAVAKKKVPAKAVKKTGAKKVVAKKVVKKAAKPAKKVVAKKPVKKVLAKKVTKPVKKVIAKKPVKKAIVKTVLKKIVKPVVKASAKKEFTNTHETKPLHSKVSTIKEIKHIIEEGVEHKTEKPVKALKVKKVKAPIVKKPIVAPTTFRITENNAPSKMMKEPAGKFEMEFVIRASEDMVFEFVSTESGLSEWFCDDVNIRDGVFTFDWDGQIQQAKLVKEIPPQLIRYQWLDKNDGSYFEFKIQKDELTNDISLIITDFASDKADEVSARLLWHSQIDKLLHVLGSFF